VLDFGLLTLKYFDCVLFEGCQDCKRAGKAFLAELAVANRADNRVAPDSVSNGAASATTEMGISH
jgi:hypothetical protein